MEIQAANNRVWVYQIDRLLSKEEEAQVKVDIDAFTAQWAAHGNALKASAQILWSCFIVLAVDENHEAASGCSIDSSARMLKDLGVRYNFDAFNRNTIAYLKDDQIVFTSLTNIQEAEGYKVFNLAVSNLKEYQEKFILDYADSAFAKLAIDSSFKCSL